MLKMNLNFFKLIKLFSEKIITNVIINKLKSLKPKSCSFCSEVKLLLYPNKDKNIDFVVLKSIDLKGIQAKLTKKNVINPEKNLFNLILKKYL